jgi:Putative Actinobacterial Holin-X, holin superfamily III
VCLRAYVDPALSRKHVAATDRLASSGGWPYAYGRTAAGSVRLMAVPGVDQVGEGSLEELVQTASRQAVLLAREQLDVARRELTARARQAGPGVAMVGGGALFAGLASGTGTAALIRLLARRPGAAAALGVTGAYAGAGAFLARQGLVRLREVGPSRADGPVEDESTQGAKRGVGPARRQTKSAANSAKRQTKSAANSAAKSPRRLKSDARSPRQATSSPKSKTASSPRRASGPRTASTRRRAS